MKLKRVWAANFGQLAIKVYKDLDDREEGGEDVSRISSCFVEVNNKRR